MISYMPSQAAAPVNKGTERRAVPADFQVVCVCGGYGYPLGSGSAARITMVGRALIHAGVPFRLLHCGPSSTPGNTQRRGVHRGVPYEYTTCVKRPSGILARWLAYTWAFAVLTAKLVQLRPQRTRTAIYFYVLTGPVVLYVNLLCRLLGLPVVQEMCEWWPGEPTCSRFTKWLYRKRIFADPTGFLVISKAVAALVAEQTDNVNPGAPIHRVPCIVDAEDFAGTPPAPLENVPQFVWCGDLRGWFNDAIFCIRALSIVKRQGYRAKLALVGAGNKRAAAEVWAAAAECCLSPDDLAIPGCISPKELIASYRSAAALLLPLRDDDRSRTRLPNKLAEYLASGRPTITCGVGDLTGLLTDRASAHVVTPGDIEEFARRMIAVLRDPADAKRIGGAAREICKRELDYHSHSEGLMKLFRDTIARANRRRARLPLMHRLRNAACETLAFALEALGVVRVWKDRAQADGCVTAIYFHKPSADVFARCVHWLQRRGYTFISTDELYEIVRGQKRAPKGAVWLSIDDGWRELLDGVIPWAQAREIPVALFVPAGILEGDGRFAWAAAENGARHAMTVDELVQISRLPAITIGGHSMTHVRMTACSDQELISQLSQCKQRLERWTGKPVRYFAYPYGAYNQHTPSVVRDCGFEMAVTTDNALITARANPYTVPRFSVADQIGFHEAVCNMVGLWRPVIDLFKRPLQLANLI